MRGGVFGQWAWVGALACSVVACGKSFPRACAPAGAGRVQRFARRRPVGRAPIGWGPRYPCAGRFARRWAGRRHPRFPSDQTGDQRTPTLVAVPYSSGGAVLAAWNHVGRDVIIELIPTPVLRKTVAY